MKTLLVVLSWQNICLFSFCNLVAWAQEAPNRAFQLELFDETAPSFRQNVCDRQAAFSAGNVTMAQALQGLEIRSVVALNQYFELDENGVLPAENPLILIKLMDEVARRGGFTWRNSYAVYEENIVPEGKTYNDMLMWLTARYDLIVSYWFDTLERRNLGVSFPEPWLDASTIMVSLKEPMQDDVFETFLFLKPFTNAVWGLIIATVFASGFVYWILELIDKKADKERLSNNPLENIYLTAISLTGQFEFAPRTAASQLFAVSVAFMALIVASAYTANLASNLVVQKQPLSPIQTLGDAVRMQVPICVWATTGTDALVTKAFPNGRFVRKPTAQGVFEGVLSGECRVAASDLPSWDYYSGRVDVNGDCRLDWIGRTYKFTKAGFAVAADSGTRCTSLIRDVINLHMGEMKLDGFVDEAYEAYLAQQAEIDCDNQGDVGSSENSNQLGLKNMGGIFTFHFGISVVAIIIALVRAQLRKKRKAAERAATMNRQQRRSARRQAKLEKRSGMEEAIITSDDEEASNERMSLDTHSLDGGFMDGLSVDSRDSDLELKTMELHIKHLGTQNKQMHRTQLETTAKIMQQLDAMTKRLEDNTTLLAAHEKAINNKGSLPTVSQSTDATETLESIPLSNEQDKMRQEMATLEQRTLQALHEMNDKLRAITKRQTEDDDDEEEENDDDETSEDCTSVQAQVASLKEEKVKRGGETTTAVPTSVSRVDESTGVTDASMTQ